MMILYGGIDPGLQGAVGVLWQTGKIEVFDIPTYEGVRGRREYDVPGMNELLVQIVGEAPSGVTFGLEAATPFAKGGKQAWRAAGRAVGLWEALLVAHKVPYLIVPAIRWKKALRLSSDKAMAVARAKQIWPTISDQLSRKRDHNRAEALLIAYYISNHLP